MRSYFDAMTERVRRFGSPLADSSGITLVESLIACLVVGICAVGLATMFARGQGIIGAEGDNRVAVYLAQQRIELARAKGYQKRGGRVAPRAGQILINILDFSDRTAHEVMTPRTRIDALQNKIVGKGEYRPGSAIDTVRFWWGYTDYKHNEIGFADPTNPASDGIRPTFTNKEWEGRAEIQLAPFHLRFAELTTAIGVQAGQQRLTAPGDDPSSPINGLFDPNKNSRLAGYVFNELKEGRIKLTDEYMVSENAWRKGGAPSHGSTMFAAIYSKVPVDDLIRGMIVQSANDACIVLAEALAGNEAAFGAKLTERARAIGLDAPDQGSH